MYCTFNPALGCAPRSLHKFYLSGKDVQEFWDGFLELQHNSCVMLVVKQTLTPAQQLPPTPTTMKRCC